MRRRERDELGRAVLEAMRNLIDDEPLPDDEVSRAMVDRVVWPGSASPSDRPSPLASARTDEPQRRRRWRSAIGGAGLALLAAAAAAVWWRAPTPVPSAPAASPLAAADPEVAPLEGDPTAESWPSEAIVVSSDEPTSLRLAEHVLVHVTQGTRLRVDRPEPRVIVLHVEQGRAVAAVREADPPTTLSLVGLETEVRSTAAVFAIEVAPQRSVVEVDVHRGSVQVRRASEALTLGEAMTLHQEGERRRLHAIDPARREADMARVGEVVAPAPAETRRRAAPRPEAASPEALLGVAREHLSAGSPALAARQYRALLERYPTSPEAAAARIALAELYLYTLNRPAAAERLFRRYLQSGGGSLAPEARSGRIEALRRLGDHAGEAQAIREFLRYHPGVGDVGALAARLERIDR